eukprot:gb/GECG01006844.1/.p1 GENE.gb/GECG01006844.1/~~gb/GECG01006844.1/.p1  ORF type:complete len:295 (+),score=28.96 gb/GECG01006844.1/:1-885(+)
MELLPWKLWFQQLPIDDDENNVEQEAVASFPLRIEVVKNPKNETIRCKQQCDLWAFCWASGAFLGELLIQPGIQQALLKRRNVIELGCGLGIPSLVCSLEPTCQVTATDLVQDALDVVKRNTQHVAAAKDSLRTSKLSWNEWGSIECPTTVYDSESYEHYDVCLGADVTFIGSNLKPVLRTMYRLLRPGGLGILVDPGRFPGITELDAYASDCGLEIVWEVSSTAAVSTPVCTLEKLNLAILRKASDKDGQIEPISTEAVQKIAQTLLDYKQKVAQRNPTEGKHHTLDLSSRLE